MIRLVRSKGISIISLFSVRECDGQLCQKLHWGLPEQEQTSGQVWNVERKSSKSLNLWHVVVQLHAQCTPSQPPSYRRYLPPSPIIHIQRGSTDTSAQETLPHSDPSGKPLSGLASPLPIKDHWASGSEANCWLPVKKSPPWLAVNFPGFNLTYPDVYWRCHVKVSFQRISSSPLGSLRDWC